MITYFTGSPNAAGVRWTFIREFIREYMKINKIRPKFHFLTKIEIKMTYIVFVCFFFNLLSSGAKRQ